MSKELECKREVKYDGRKIEIAGIDILNTKLGEIEVEPVLLQAVGHALMLIDYSQYKLCMSIREMKDDRQIEQFKRLWFQDNYRARKIYDAIAALTVKPNSNKLEDVVAEMIMSSPRILEIERTSDSEESLMIGNTSFKEKIEDLKNDVHTEAKFYDVVIKRLDRMLDNPGFTSMSYPEAPRDVHTTLLEIDEWMDDIFLDRNIINQYRQIRGPWKQQYTTDSTTRRKFVYDVRDFRNLLANTYNELIKHKTGECMGPIELDEKEYQIVD